MMKHMLLMAQEELGVFEDINFKNKDTAGWEVFWMLLGAYLLGLLTYWLIHRYYHGSGETPEAASRVANDDADDLTIIEGIGPKIKELLNDADIHTFEDLAGASRSDVKQILEDAGPRFRMHEPKSWIRQAGLAAEGKFSELEELQERLNAGR